MNNILLTVVSVVAITQCKSQNKLSTYENSNYNIEIENINRSDKSSEVIDTISSCKDICLNFPSFINRSSLAKEDPINLSITNNSANTIIAGDTFQIDKKSDSDNFWKKVKLNGIISNIGYKVNAKSELNMKMETYFVRNLSVGTYRITKQITVLPEKNELFLIKEFTVTN